MNASKALLLTALLTTSIVVASARTMTSQEVPTPQANAGQATNLTTSAELDAARKLIADLSTRVSVLEEKLTAMAWTTKYEARLFGALEWQAVVPQVRPGDRIEVEADGLWRFGDSYEAVGPEGATGGPVSYNAFKGHHHGALVMTLDPVAAFNSDAAETVVSVGKKMWTTVPAGYLGPLFMRMNDRDVDNNSGELFVTVVVHRVPKR